ncbi:uncharacterized protein LOC135843978 isoform X2 [Planococcus citri]
MSGTLLIVMLTLTHHSNGLALWSPSPNPAESPEPENLSKIPPKSCPNFNVMKVEQNFLGNMEDVWVISHIVPRGKSQYVDGSTACGLYNFVPGECKCLRYGLSVNEQENSLTRKTVGLEVRTQNFRYIESKVVFVEDYYDVFQAQFLLAAEVNFDGTKTKITASPIDEEIYPEYQAYALLATDNYETYAVFASCTPFSSGPHAWVAVSNEAFLVINKQDLLLKVEKILLENGIDLKNMVEVDQTNCLPLNA